MARQKYYRQPPEYDLDDIKNIIRSKVPGTIKFGQKKHQKNKIYKDLKELGLTFPRAIEIIEKRLTTKHFKHPAPRAGNSWADVYKITINKELAYIKLKIEKRENDTVVIISFHKDQPKRGKLL
jgi:MqsR (Motility quorum-sensing regulator) toxin of toxin-antitoxin system